LQLMKPNMASPHFGAQIGKHILVGQADNSVMLRATVQA
jgi:hypothetical protein